MKEETKIEIKMPYFEENELEFIDNNIHELAHKFTEQFVKEKDLLIAQRIVKNLEQELQRKDNIIKSLISYLETQINDYKEMGYNQSKIREKDLWMAGQYDEDIFILDRLKELKELENGNK